MSDLILKNVHLLDPSEKLDSLSDILISDGKIKKISKKIDNNNEKVIDCKNRLLVPGLIDFHVHYRDPGETYKEDIKSGSIASAKGGFTTVVMMANTNPAIDSLDKLNDQKRTIELHSKIRILQTSALTLGRRGENLVNIEELSESGIVAFSDDGDVVEDKELFIEGLKRSNAKKFFVLQHAEAKSLIDDGSANDGPPAIRMGLAARTRDAEISIIKRDIQIAKENKLKLYFQHISTKEGVEIIRNAKKEGLEIQSEVTPHHLFLNENWVYGKKGDIPGYLDLDSYDTNFRVNPPIREEEDRISLLAGIKDGTIDIIATDHAPHSEGDKLNTFDSAPAGINGAETALLTLLTIVSKGELHINDVIRTMSNNPSKLLNNLLGINIGKIKENYQADLTLIDRNKKTKITEDFFSSKSKNSPLIGSEMIGEIVMTMVGGKIVYG